MLRKHTKLFKGEDIPEKKPYNQEIEELKNYIEKDNTPEFIKPTDISTMTKCIRFYKKFSVDCDIKNQATHQPLHSLLQDFERCLLKNSSDEQVPTIHKLMELEEDCPDSNKKLSQSKNNRFYEKLETILAKIELHYLGDEPGHKIELDNKRRRQELKQERNPNTVGYVLGDRKATKIYEKFQSKTQPSVSGEGSEYHSKMKILDTVEKAFKFHRPINASKTECRENIKYRGNPRSDRIKHERMLRFGEAQLELLNRFRDRDIIKNDQFASNLVSLNSTLGGFQKIAFKDRIYQDLKKSGAFDDTETQLDDLDQNKRNVWDSDDIDPKSRLLKGTQNLYQKKLATITQLPTSLPGQTMAWERLKKTKRNMIRKNMTTYGGFGGDLNKDLSKTGYGEGHFLKDKSFDEVFSDSLKPKQKQCNVSCVDQLQDSKIDNRILTLERSYGKGSNEQNSTRLNSQTFCYDKLLEIDMMCSDGVLHDRTGVSGSVDCIGQNEQSKKNDSEIKNLGSYDGYKPVNGIIESQKVIDCSPKKNENFSNKVRQSCALTQSMMHKLNQSSNRNIGTPEGDICEIDENIMDTEYNIVTEQTEKSQKNIFNVPISPVKTNSCDLTHTSMGEDLPQNHKIPEYNNINDNAVISGVTAGYDPDQQKQPNINHKDQSPNSMTEIGPINKNLHTLPISKANFEKLAPEIQSKSIFLNGEIVTERKYHESPHTYIEKKLQQSKRQTAVSKPIDLSTIITSMKQDIKTRNNSLQKKYQENLAQISNNAKVTKLQYSKIVTRKPIIKNLKESEIPTKRIRANDNYSIYKTSKTFKAKSNLSMAAEDKSSTGQNAQENNTIKINQSKNLYSNDPIQPIMQHENFNTKQTEIIDERSRKRNSLNYHLTNMNTVRNLCHKKKLNREIKLDQTLDKEQADVELFGKTISHPCRTDKSSKTPKISHTKKKFQRPNLLNHSDIAISRLDTTDPSHQCQKLLNEIGDLQSERPHFKSKIEKVRDCYDNQIYKIKEYQDWRHKNKNQFLYFYFFP